MPLHVDGARLFNAVVALRTPASRACLRPPTAPRSASRRDWPVPVGSVVVGDREFIARARRARKMVGGGMRQAGVLAAAGLVALRDGPAGMIERLADDHRHARRLAEGLAALDGIVDLDPERVRTNYVVFGLRQRRDLDPLEARGAFLAELTRRGVLCIPYSHGRIRALTHHGIEAADIEHVLVAARDGLRDVGLAPLVA